MTKVTTVNQMHNDFFDALAKDQPHYNPLLTDVCCNNPCAAMLCQRMAFFTLRARREGGKGWFDKTHDEWFDELRFTRTRLETSRKILLEIGVLEERRWGIPAKMWYRIDVDRLAELFRKARRAEHKRLAKKKVEQWPDQNHQRPPEPNQILEQ